MSSKQTVAAPFQPEKSAREEDAWLNDVGPRVLPLAQEILRKESTTDFLPERSPTDRYLSLPDYKEKGNEYLLDPQHPLREMVLRLSGLIWHKLQDTLNDLSLSESTLADRVRREAIEYVREEPVQPHVIQGLADADRLLRGVVSEVLGYGPLEGLVEDRAITEIIVTAPDCTYVKRGGRVEEMPCHFVDEQHMLRITNNFLRRAGKHVRSDWSIIDGYLPDGSLFTAALPPHTTGGPIITLHKPAQQRFTVEDCVRGGLLNQQMAEFLLACVQARLNILICGGADTGKTALLNALCMSIPEHEHIVTIEELAELHLKRRWHVALLSGRVSAGERVTPRDLLQHAERMRPEHLIVGECRGNETGELIRMMNNGQEGVMTTLYAQSIRDGLARLKMFCQEGEMELADTVLQARLTRALQVIVHLVRLPDGSRKISTIAEILRSSGQEMKLRTIFHYMAEESDETRGTFLASGFPPTFLERLRERGLHLPDDMFVPCTVPLSATARHS